MIVDAIVRFPPITSPPAASVQQAAQTMHHHRVGSVLVLDGGRLVGILTETDVVRLVAQGRDPRAVAVRDVMSSPVVTIEASAELEAAAQLMKDRHLKRLVVVVGPTLRGVITVRDMAYAMPEIGNRALDAIRARWEDEPR